MLKISSATLLAMLALVFVACQKDLKSPAVTSDAAKKTVITAPQVTCDDPNSTKTDISLVITAGSTGLPAGFSVQWMTAADYAANGNQWYASDDPRLCKASFSGNANNSRYNLAAGESIAVQIGDILFDNGASAVSCGLDGLICGTQYMFRVFGHATSTLAKSDFTYQNCSTSPCDETCTRHHFGWWKGHCDQLTDLQIAGINYTATELCTILNTSGTGNGLVILAHQLIPALMSGATAENNGDVAAALAAIENNGSPYDLRNGTTDSNWQKALSGRLNRYNNCQ